AIALLAIIACALRRAVPAWSRGASTAVWGPTMILLALTVAGAGVWSVGYRLVYRVPEFSERGAGGFLIARFGGDPQDTLRGLFARDLADIINQEGIVKYIGVRPDNIPKYRLEQRLGLL